MTNIEKDISGMVLRIERSSIHDGDGFRTVVFMKGCPLNCQWCSTPESHSFKVEKAEHNIYGKTMTVEEVMKEVRKDSAFFFHSGGGMTLSGGEPLAQPKFALALVKEAKSECINVAMETSFYAAWTVVEPILNNTDIAFVDIKFINSELHKKYCGTDNSLILDNLLHTNDIEKPLRLIVRIPIIPGINDEKGELDLIGQFCAKLKHLQHVQLLPYHRLGSNTYQKLGKPYLLADVPTPSQEHMLKCKEIILKHVKHVI